MGNGKKIFISKLRKAGFIAFLVLLGLVMLGAIGSMIQTVFIKIEHPEHLDPGAQAK